MVVYMVIRNDFLYWLVDGLRFKHINGICLNNDNYLNGLVNVFNELDYKECFKYNNNLTLENAKFSLDCFFNNLNFNRYDLTIKHGVVTWKIDDKTYVGFNSKKSNYNDGKNDIDKEYLKEWKQYGYYFYK